MVQGDCVGFVACTWKCLQAVGFGTAVTWPDTSLFLNLGGRAGGSEIEENEVGTGEAVVTPATKIGEIEKSMVTKMCSGTVNEVGTGEAVVTPATEIGEIEESMVSEIRRETVNENTETKEGERGEAVDSAVIEIGEIEESMVAVIRSDSINKNAETKEEKTGDTLDTALIELDEIEELMVAELCRQTAREEIVTKMRSETLREEIVAEMRSETVTEEPEMREAVTEIDQSRPVSYDFLLADGGRDFEDSIDIISITGGTARNVLIFLSLQQVD
uniref:Uncharacterized protein LOC117355504 isoform X9 n=1 Tax=Geotrypetes seraphini TaxID=260995 RepID=A0A6P8Q1I0_GEOSA|nr:uncharacterized protein LOC117355504 isoform X9 [Geotrypetes seraphini]